MTDNKFVTHVELEANGLIQQGKQAGEYYTKFTGKLISDSKKVTVGWMDMIKKMSGTQLALKGLQGAFDKFKQGLLSTRSAQETWDVTCAKVDAGLDTFFKTLVTGNWAEFTTNL
ncbi:MAG: hypothetical protein LBK58_13595 [Prevotellaceae bacterium]|jgi:hypothetical protein|nr:hypothetical protein [Prevotellaceae bacterium]